MNSKIFYRKHLLLIIKYLLLRNSFVSSLLILIFDTDYPKFAVWAWENYGGLFVTARRIWMDHPEPPETARASEVGGWWPESEFFWLDWGQKRWYVAEGRVPRLPRLQQPQLQQFLEKELQERHLRQWKKGVESALRPPPTPPPWSKYFSCHYRRVFCIFCFCRQPRNLECQVFRLLPSRKRRRVQESSRNWMIDNRK